MTDATSQENNKGLTLDGITPAHAVLILLSLGMVVSGLYLTKHFYDVQFPTSILEGSLCNISGFLNCDVATFSPLSNIFYVPISFLGAMIGVFLLIGSIFAYPSVERTNKLVVYVNGFLCLGLAAYSLIALRGLCPVCSFYWLCSWVALFLFHKYGVKDFRPSVKVLTLYALPILIGGFFLHKHYVKKQNEQTALASNVIQQYYSLPQVGDPQEDSPYRIASATQKFSETPIRMSIFSDFQCPACRVLSEYMPLLEKRYQGKINIQYFFYPLDITCNPNMSYALHPVACRAAYVASCLSPDKFRSMHDQFFKDQAKLDYRYMNELAKQHNVTECAESPQTKELVMNHVKIGENFQVGSTPTIILNGVRITGVIPINLMYAILDEILKRSNK